jgi:DNA polymerase-3 subunit alpha
VFEQIVDRTLARRREAEAGTMSLFDSVEPADGASPVFDERITIPDIEFEKMPRLAFEKEMLGLYVSDHPLLGAEAALRRVADVTIADFKTATDGEMKWVGGVVTNLTRKYTKKGDLMATFFLEDLASTIEAWVFPRTHLDYGALLADDAIVCVKGRLDLREDQPKLVVMEVKCPELAFDGGPPLRLKLPVGRLNDSIVTQLKDLFVRHPGDSPVFLHVGEKILKLGADFAVDATKGLCAELRVLLGADCLLA